MLNRLYVHLARVRQSPDEAPQHVEERLQFFSSGVSGCASRLCAGRTRRHFEKHTTRKSTTETREKRRMRSAQRGQRREQRRESSQREAVDFWEKTRCQSSRNPEATEGRKQQRRDRETWKYVQYGALQLEMHSGVCRRERLADYQRRLNQARTLTCETTYLKLKSITLRQLFGICVSLCNDAFRVLPLGLKGRREPAKTEREQDESPPRLPHQACVSDERSFESPTNLDNCKGRKNRDTL